MEQSSENKVRCRVCTNEIESIENCCEISSTHEQNFFAVTQMELEDSKILSSVICGSCDEILENFAYFKQLIVQRHQMLYDMWYDGADYDEESDDYDDELDIKAEPIELKECQVSIERLNPQLLRTLLPSRENYELILVKLERNDDEQIHSLACNNLEGSDTINQEGDSRSETSVVQVVVKETSLPVS